MKFLSSCALFGLCLSFAPLAEAAIAVEISPNDGIRALGGVVIKGVTYDVCFDGSFGDTMFMGDEEGALEAAQTIALVFNDYASYGPNGGIFPSTFPTVDNEAGGGVSGTGMFFEITFGPLPDEHRDFILARYAAGWTVWNPEQPSMAGSNHVEATFRLHIPGAVIHNVPEPGGLLMSSLGLLLAIRRRR